MCEGFPFAFAFSLVDRLAVVLSPSILTGKCLAITFWLLLPPAARRWKNDAGSSGPGEWLMRCGEPPGDHQRTRLAWTEERRDGRKVGKVR